MRVMIYTETMDAYRHMRDQLDAGLPAEQGIRWLSPATAHHRLMGIERGTLLLLAYSCTKFTEEMLELIATRQIIVVPVSCDSCYTYRARNAATYLIDRWKAEYEQAFTEDEAP